MKQFLYTAYICLLLLPSFCLHLSAQTTDDTRGYTAKIGDKVPNIELMLADSSTVSLKKLLKKNALVMLQFTASWCGVCRQEMPHIESELWQAYQSKGLAVIGVDYKEPIEKVRDFAQKMAITYPLALDPKGDIFALFAKPNAGVTRNILIDRKRRIVFLTRLFDPAEFETLKTTIAQKLK